MQFFTSVNQTSQDLDKRLVPVVEIVTDCLNYLSHDIDAC